MIRNVTCVECPTGCHMTATVENASVVHVEGHGCSRGYDYATAESTDSQRVLTSTIPATGLSLRVVPVRTSVPIPRDKWREAMRVIRAARIDHPVWAGDVVVADILGLEADVVATRDVS